MNLTQITEKLTDVKNVVVNSVSATSNFVYNASNVQVLKLKKGSLVTEFDKKKKQNETYHKLLEERKHLEQLILQINMKRSHYDMKIAQIVFSTEDPHNIKHDYEEIEKSLAVLNNKLQEIYGKFATLTEMTDENLEKERLIFEESVYDINKKLKDSRKNKNNAYNQLSSQLSKLAEPITNIDECYDIDTEESYSDDAYDVDNMDNTHDADNKSSNKSFEELCAYVTDMTGAGKMAINEENLRL